MSLCEEDGGVAPADVVTEVSECDDDGVVPITVELNTAATELVLALEAV